MLSDPSRLGSGQPADRSFFTGVYLGVSNQGPVTTSKISQMYRKAADGGWGSSLELRGPAHLLQGRTEGISTMSTDPASGTALLASPLFAPPAPLEPAGFCGEAPREVPWSRAGPFLGPFLPLLDPRDDLEGRGGYGTSREGAFSGPGGPGKLSRSRGGSLAYFGPLVD